MNVEFHVFIIIALGGGKWSLNAMITSYSGLKLAFHKANPLSELCGIVDSYTTILWVMWEAVTVVEGTP
jgi:hypothetical protein